MLTDPRRAAGGGSKASRRHGAASWEEFHTESVDEFRELDDQRVLVLHRWGGRGKTSGLELGEMPAKGASLFHLRNGKVIRAVTYFDRNNALTELAPNGE